ncbi:hypothetical protein Tco_1173897 [Tanacetum coccineum]
MSTRSSTRNLFPPLEDPERTIQRRTRVDPNSLNDFEEINMAANGNGDDGLPPAGGGLPVLDLRTMEELCQPTLNGRANDDILKNMQTNMTTLANSTNDLKNMLGQFMKMNTASTSRSGSNTITNPREDLKGITTRSGVAYKGPTIPTASSSPKVVERETEPNQKPSIPYPSRLNDQKLREKADNQIEKFYEIFKDLSFEISFTDALLLMPKFASTLKALIGNKEKLRELTLRVGKEAVTFNLDQTSRYSSNYDDNSVNRIDIIDMACEEYSQEVLGFSDVIASGNPTPYYDPIVSTSSPTLTPFGDSDFLLEEVTLFLALEMIQLHRN